MAKSNITQLIRESVQGDEKVLGQLFALIYEELHRIAAAKMRNEVANHTLQPTALVNEAYLRLIELKKIQWQNRGHFFAMAAKIMRRVLIDHAKNKKAGKRGGPGRICVTFDEQIHGAENDAVDLLALDEALDKLAKADPELAQIVELRFFAGMNLDEITSELGVSSGTIKRKWTKAKVWLFHELKRK